MQPPDAARVGDDLPASPPNLVLVDMAEHHDVRVGREQAAGDHFVV